MTREEFFEWVGMVVFVLVVLGVAALFGGCQPRVVDVPATLWLDPELPADYAEGALGARDWWLEQVPGVIVGTVSSAEPGCGIYVRVGEPDEDWAQTHRNDTCRATVTVKRGLHRLEVRRVLMHEYGHAFLGGEHRGDGNVMGETWAATLDADQRVELEGRMGR